jgi:hypothetical protein
MYLVYACCNMDCDSYGEAVEVGPGDSVECEECGWFMEAVV